MRNGIFTLLLLSTLVVFAQSNEEVVYGWVSAPSGLSIRNEPTTSGERLAVIPYKSRVVVKERKAMVRLAGTLGEWTGVEWNGKSGWVYGGFLSDLHPDYFDDLNTEACDDLESYFVDRNEKLKLARVVVEAGSSYSITPEGKLVEDGNQDIPEGYGLTVRYYYENGIVLEDIEGYEWFETAFYFDRTRYDIFELFDFAKSMHKEEYGDYLDMEDGELRLPIQSVEWSNDNVGYRSFKAIVENGEFKHFRIDEEEGCGVYWVFDARTDNIIIAEGGGC